MVWPASRLAAAALLWTGPLTAVALPSAVDAQAVRTFTVTAENDGFTFWTPPRERSDWYFTHAMELAAVLAWAPGGVPLLADEGVPVCPPGASDEPCLLTRVALGQAIYTPQGLFDYEGQTTDRPYAGWLYVDATTARIDSTSFTSVGLQVGVTGAPSMGGSAHRWFHRALGKHEPVGWEHEIPFEIAFQADYEARRALPLVPGSPRLLALQPRGRATVGTLRTAATAGLDLTLGCALAECMGWVAPERSFYVFASLGAEGELVLRDLFLDGSTLGRSSSTDRVPWLGRVEGRVQVGGQRVALEFAATASTVEFRHQREPHARGRVRVLIRP